MGNKASKVATSASRATATTRSSLNGVSTASSEAAAPRNINIKGDAVTPASETKSNAILKDASDPSSPISGMLSKNLASLGQVDVRSAQKHDSSRFNPNTQSARVLQRRKELEDSESSLSTGSPSSSRSNPALRNRLTPSSLTTLLDARKEVKSPEELRRLCADFNCDPETVERLCKYITSPSVSLVRSPKQEKEDTYLARWVDPQPMHERIA